MTKKSGYTWQDLCYLFSLRKESYMRLFFLFVGLFFLFFLFQPSLYQVSATFKCGEGKRIEREKVQGGTCGAQSIVESRALLKPASEKMGYMLRVRHPWWQRMLRTFQNRLCAEMGIPLPLRDQLVFANTIFPGDQFEHFFIFFDDARNFSIFDKKKTLLERGTVGKVVNTLQGSFVIKETSRPLLRHFYRVEPISCSSAVKKVEKHLKVEWSRKDRSVLVIGFKDVNKERAARFVNFLMELYQGYLQEENERLVKEEIAYLQKRKEELLEQESLAFTKALGVQKESIEEQIKALQTSGCYVPDKWKKESDLLIQREISTGVLETLAQLAEAKTCYRRFATVESKPIDKAVSPYKATKGYGFLLAPIGGCLAILALFGLRMGSYMLRGIVVTEGSSKNLGIAFCGYLRNQMERKKSIRKVASWIDFCKDKKEERAVCVALICEDAIFSEQVAISLAQRDKKILFIECVSKEKKEIKGRGLYPFLAGFGPAKIYEENGIDKIYAGVQEEEYVELLSKELFVHFVEVKKPSYDVILLGVQADNTDPCIDPIRRASELFLVQKKEIFFEEIAFLSPAAVVLSK